MPVNAVLLRVREWARRTWRRAVVTVLIVGVLGGAVLAVAAGARRTASVPDRFTAAVGGEVDLVLAQYEGAPLTEMIRSLPGVAGASGATFVAAWPVGRDGEFVSTTNPFAGDAHAFAGLVVDGRYADPAAADEFTVNRALAAQLGAEVGDQVEIAMFDAEQTASPGFDATAEPGLGRLSATLVGITVAGTDFEAPAPAITYSGALLSAHPGLGIVASFILVDLEPGAEGDEVLAAAQRLPGGAVLQRATDTQQVTASTRRAVDFVALSLWVVAGVAALGATAVIALLVAQTVGPGVDDRRTLRALGWRRSDFVTEALIESAVVGAGAMVVAAVVAVTVSALFPFGAPRLLEPDPGLQIDGAVITGGGFALLGICSLAALATTERRPPRAARATGAGSLPHRWSRHRWSMPFVVGVRYALAPAPRRRSCWTILAPGAIGCAGLVAALTVGLSASRLVDEPARWGRNFDYAYGNQWMPGGPDLVGPALADRDVERVSVATLGALAFDGDEVQVLAFETLRGALAPPTLEGRAPSEAGEVGLGREVARRLDKHIGDTVQVGVAEGDPHELKVVGIVMTPYDAGRGAAMTYQTYAALVDHASQNLLLVDFADDARPDAADDLAAATNTLSEDFSAVLPTSIGSLERVRSMPYLLAGILASLGAAAMLPTLSGSVRDRRHELGVMRALGAVGGQLRGVLHVQATTVAAVVLVVGVPLGLLVGRGLFAAIADSLGVDPEPRIAWAMTPALAALVVVVTNLVAVVPGIRAAHTAVVDLVRNR